MPMLVPDGTGEERRTTGLGWLGDIAAWNLWAFLGLLLLIQILFKELGYGVGCRASAEARNEGVGIIVGGILGLMAFTLALTLNALSVRLSDRRAGAMAEANAIGSAWLRATAIGGETGQTLAGLVADYAVERLRYVEAGRDDPVLAEATERTNALQAEISDTLAALALVRQDPVVVSFMESANHMFDMTAAQRFAISNYLPGAMIWLLLLITLGAMFSLGMQLGFLGRPNRALVAILCLLWSAVMMQVLDMGTSRIGRYEIETSPYLWMMGGIGLAVPEPG